MRVDERTIEELARIRRERDTLHEKWQEAERLCGIACEEREESEAETRALLSAIREHERASYEKSFAPRIAPTDKRLYEAAKRVSDG